MKLQWPRFNLPLVPALSLAIGIMLLGAFELWRGYRDATGRAEEAAQNLVHVLAEQTERTIQSIDFTLQGISDTLEASPGLPAHDERFRETLNKRLSALPYVRALFVVGPDGSPIHDTGYPATPRLNALDRPYFHAHQNSSSLGLHIGQPLRSRSTNTWFVSFSRRVSQPDAIFGGVIVAAVEPSYFEHFYRGLSVGEGGFIALLLRDGTILARSPADGAIGRSFADAEPIFSLVGKNPKGVYWATSPVDGTPRVVGYRALGNSPVVVLVGLAQATVFQPWRQHATVVVVAAAILLCLISVLIFLVHESRKRELGEQARLNRAHRLEALGRIAGGIAHDFGNTLRIMHSTCMLLKPHLVGNSDALSVIGEADHSLRSARAMIQRLLAFARRQELHPKPAVIDELISGFTPILRQAAGPRASLEIRLASSNAACLLDPVHFEASLLNLILNARDAMPRGGTITVETAAIPPPGKAEGKGRSWVQVVVRDTGAGMPPAVVEQAFEPFFTTKQSEEGNGLGLSQVLGFVQQSAGDVQLESQEGHGTTVRLMFPALADEPRTASAGVLLPSAQTSENDHCAPKTAGPKRNRVRKPLSTASGHRLMGSEDQQR